VRIESKHWVALEALNAAELMAAVAAFVAAVMRKWELWFFLMFSFSVCAIALRHLSERCPRRSPENRLMTSVRKGVVGVAILGAALLNLSAIMFPSFTPLEDAFDYIAFGKPPGDGWVFAYRTAEYLGYLSSKSIRRIGDVVEFDCRILPRIDLRRNGVDYLVVHTSANCVTHLAVSKDAVYSFATTGRRLETFVPDLPFRWTNAQGRVNSILKYACARSSG
jgi:hypothetical protein